MKDSNKSMIEKVDMWLGTDTKILNELLPSLCTSTLDQEHAKEIRQTIWTVAFVLKNVANFLQFNRSKTNQEKTSIHHDWQNLLQSTQCCYTWEQKQNCSTLAKQCKTYHDFLKLPIVERKIAGISAEKGHKHAANTSSDNEAGISPMSTTKKDSCSEGR